MNHKEAQEAIEAGRTTLGIEFGSTRIKAALVGDDHMPVATGSHSWENRHEDGIWTYRLDDIWTGLQECYRSLRADVLANYDIEFQRTGAIGFSGMMHGYMAFDGNDSLLVPFRTYRNTITEQASAELTRLFQFNIPQRWSIAHLQQAILNREPHVEEIRFLTTLAGYVHWTLSGEQVLGVGEASGVFPIDSQTNSYDKRMVDLFNDRLDASSISWRLDDILPKVLVAGEPGGVLTDVGAALLDPSGKLQPGVPLSPPEGDAGTGMVATNSIAVRSGNVSAGTTVFAMIVLEEALSELHPEIDMVTTPTGKPVAMVHSNNCTSEINAWVALFGELAEAMGAETSRSELFELLFKRALDGEADCGGLLSYNYLAGEHITNLEEGRPLFVRHPDDRFDLSNFMRVQLFSALAALKIGLEILFDQEHVKVDRILGHGGFFKTKEVGQKIMAAAMNVPVTVMETAGEGGAWGSALLAAFMKSRSKDESLEDYLADRVFADQRGIEIAPDPNDVEGFAAFIERYKKGLVIERAALDGLR
jgi:sugar (pentulose or hexulose) kinase